MGMVLYFVLGVTSGVVTGVMAGGKRYLVKASSRSSGNFIINVTRSSLSLFQSDPPTLGLPSGLFHSTPADTRSSKDALPNL